MKHAQSFSRIFHERQNVKMPNVYTSVSRKQFEVIHNSFLRFSTNTHASHVTYQSLNFIYFGDEFVQFLGVFRFRVGHVDACRWQPRASASGIRSYRKFPPQSILYLYFYVTVFYIEIDVTLVNFVILFSSTYSGDDRVVTVLIGLERPKL